MSNQDKDAKQSQGREADASADPHLLGTLSPDAFGARVPAIISSASNRIFQQHMSHERPFPDMEMVRSRATEPQTVAAVSNMLQSPINDDTGFYTAWTAFYEVIVDLPLSTLDLYRPALTTLSSTPETTAPSHHARATSLARDASSLLAFMDDTSAVWVPKTKGDYLAERSLRERVSSADEMRPHVPALLEWLADPNWPPFRGCRAQLARFPEVAVGPIGELVRKERGDGGWILSLMEFVDECVPMEMAAEMAAELSQTVKALVDEPRGDEDEWEVAEVARGWLDRLDAWKREQKNLEK
ncbi:hypothetical protein ACJ41O_003883 [Fusarium nematophilum]